MINKILLPLVVSLILTGCASDGGLAEKKG